MLEPWLICEIKRSIVTFLWVCSANNIYFFEAAINIKLMKMWPLHCCNVPILMFRLLMFRWALLDKAHLNINGMPIHILDAGTQRHDLTARNSNANNSNTQTRAVKLIKVDEWIICRYAGESIIKSIFTKKSPQFKTIQEHITIADESLECNPVSQHLLICVLSIFWWEKHELNIKNKTMENIKKLFNALLVNTLKSRLNHQSEAVLLL